MTPPLRGDRRPRRRARLHRDDGASDALGLALVAPAAVGLALVIVLLGRGVDSRATVQGAAESAAQAAARERGPAAATRAAERVGARALADEAACEAPRVRVDTSGFGPGGIVTVTVSCTVDTTGLDLVAPARARGWSATAHATIDPYRSAEGGP
jgi:Flp pilus assembly protein TadG